MPNCLVCGTDNAKQHYGSWCCNGCKGFFWRSVSSKRRYLCLNRSCSEVECELQDGRRNSCRACRMKKCLEVGMDPNLIRDCWGKTASSHGEPCRQRAQSMGACANAGSALERLKSEQPQSAASPPSSPCPEQRHPSRGGLMSAGSLQLLSSYLEWVQGLAELRLLGEEDKNLLMLSRARPCAWLVMARQQFDLDRKAAPQSDARKLEVLSTEIVGPLRELDAHAVELELLRCICFFSTGPQLSADAHRVVASVQSSYLKALSEFALKQFATGEQHKHPDSAAGHTLLDAVFRLNRLINVLSAVEKISYQYD